MNSKIDGVAKTSNVIASIIDLNTYQNRRIGFEGR